MIVVYHDVGGTHSSAVAANIHINRLPADSVPDSSEILSLPTFDRIESKDTGHLIFIGRDEFGADVYTLKRLYSPRIPLRVLMDMYGLLNGNSGGLYLANTSPTVNPFMGIGGYSSRVLHLVAFGRPIVAYGTMRAYMDIARLVLAVKSRMRSDLGLSQ